MPLVISHCLPRDCDFARQGIARLRLDRRVGFAAVFGSGIVPSLTLGLDFVVAHYTRRVPCF